MFALLYDSLKQKIEILDILEPISFKISTGQPFCD